MWGQPPSAVRRAQPGSLGWETERTLKNEVGTVLRK
jgi:hypothetical protein